MIAVALRSALTLLGCCLTMTASSPWGAEPRLFIRVNQLGYLTASPKVAVVCALDSIPRVTYSVTDSRGALVLRRTTSSLGSFASCRSTHRLDLTVLDRP